VKNRIILLLDDLTWDEAYPILVATKGMVWGYKLRKVILEKGIKIIEEVKKYGNVMVDFKLYDIPSAMTESLLYHQKNGADITTVHCSSQYAVEKNVDMSKIAGVTILTSFGDEIFRYYKECPQIKDLVREMCERSYILDYGYVVCSPLELDSIKDINIKKITPGIRPVWYSPSAAKWDDDQTRISTPAGAINAGADLLVIGRPILKADNIVAAIMKTNDEINEVL